MPNTAAPLLGALPNNFTAEREVSERLTRAIARLDSDDQRTIRSLLRSELTREQRADLERITSTAGFRSATVEGLTSVLHHLAVQQRSGQSATELSWILREPQFLRLGAHDQARMIQLLSAPPPSALLGEALGQLLQRSLLDGTPAILSRDSTGATLLDRLTEIATMSIHADLATARMPGGRGITRSDTLRAVVHECSRPALQVDQGSRGACGAASLQDMLCRTQPAEYARLVTGLFARKEVRLAGGEMLRVVPDSIVPCPAPDTGNVDLRSHPERLLQSALLDYTDTIFRYSYVRDSKGIPRDASPLVRSLAQLAGGGNDPHISVMSGGMRNNELIRGLEGLFGRRFTTASGNSAEIHAALRAQRAPAVIAMRWSAGNHALVYCATEEGWVYLKDPNGGIGEDTSGPRREKTNLHGANIRMRADLFEQHLLDGFVPSPPPAPLPVLTLPPAVPLVLPRVAPAIRVQVEQMADGVPTPREALEALAEANRQVERTAAQLVLPPLRPARAALRWLRNQ